MVDNIKGFRKIRRQNKAKKIHLHPRKRAKIGEKVREWFL